MQTRCQLLEKTNATQKNRTRTNFKRTNTSTKTLPTNSLSNEQLYSFNEVQQLIDNKEISQQKNNNIMLSQQFSLPVGCTTMKTRMQEVKLDETLKIEQENLSYRKITDSTTSASTVLATSNEELWEFNTEQQETSNNLGKHHKQLINNKIVENLHQNNKNIFLPQQISLPAPDQPTKITKKLCKHELQKLPTKNGWAKQLQQKDIFQIKNFCFDKNLVTRTATTSNLEQNSTKFDVIENKSQNLTTQQKDIQYFPELLFYKFQENTDEYL